jgi:hypothetical protein
MMVTDNSVLLSFLDQEEGQIGYDPSTGWLPGAAPSDASAVAGPSRLPDNRPELMDEDPFYCEGANMAFNRTNYVRMGREYKQSYNRNLSLGLPPPLGSLSFPSGRGPTAEDPQDDQAVTALMDLVAQEKQPADITHAALFVQRICELRLEAKELPGHWCLVVEQWSAMPPKIKNTKTSEMHRTITTLKKGSNVSIGSNLKKWMEYISNYPNQRPMGIRLNTYGIPHIGDISVHLAIAHLTVRNPLEEPKFGPVPKFSQDERK